MEQPEWLKRITYGLSEGKEISVLIEGKKCAVIKIPGGFWSDNGGRYYGAVSYDLVRKDSREAVGVIEGETLQEGGRVGKTKLAEWKTKVEACDAEPSKF
jgi:hypothetical protein